jgi:hypothetical protein
MGEIVGCSVGLDGQLQLSDYQIIDDNLQSDITDGKWVGEPALNLFDSKPRVFFNKLLNLFYSFYDV